LTKQRWAYPKKLTYLGEKISESPANKRCARLSSQWVRVKSVVVSRPSRNGSSTNKGRITKERRDLGTVLAERTGVDNLVDLTGWVDTKGASREEGGRKGEKGKELHLQYLLSWRRK
jgi:hypothetical protein